MIGQRKRLVFRLSTSNRGEQELYKWLEGLKTLRKFSETMRSALFLFKSLSEGRTDILEDMFPWVLEATKTEDVSKQFEEIIQQQKNLMDAVKNSSSSSSSSSVEVVKNILNEDFLVDKKEYTEKDDLEAAKRMLSSF